MSDRNAIKVSDVKRGWAIVSVTVLVTLWLGSVQSDTSANSRWIEGRKTELVKEKEREQQWRLDVTDRLARIEQAVGATPPRNDRRVTQTAGTK